VGSVRDEFVDADSGTKMQRRVPWREKQREESTFAVLADAVTASNETRRNKS
jgi:hypothetical protein